MEHLEKLIDRIIDRVNINLRKPAFDVGIYFRNLIPLEQFTRFYAFYSLTLHHPLELHFAQSSIAGSYFLGKCIVDHSILYKTDVRGDELKAGGDTFTFEDLEIPLHKDEVIRIRNSYLVMNLIHNHSHNPESPEEFLIQNTASMHYANIHGSPVEGSFLGAFATIDFTMVHDCVIGAFAYVQTNEISHSFVEPGKVWVNSPDVFDFSYQFPKEILDRYIRVEPGQKPAGIFMDFAEKRKEDFQKVFEMVQSGSEVSVCEGASLSRYAVVKGNVEIEANVLVAQRAYLENVHMGKGSNAQENCSFINCHLEGLNIGAHGSKVIAVRLGKKVFVGFNSFLRGTTWGGLRIGEGSIVMPHTIIDAEEPLEIPEHHLIWGFIGNRADLEKNTISLEKLSKITGAIESGAMRFEGNGSALVEAFTKRIEHILDANGACFDGVNNRGHAQKARNISFNTIQPYPEGPLKGLYPTIDIRP